MLASNPRLPTDTTVYAHLAEKAFLISKHKRELLQKSGESFNVFSMLRLEYDEEKLHSRFIAGLLNPKGQHGQGSAFLEYFLEKVDIVIQDKRKLHATQVKVEWNTGPISPDGLKGGSIDILVIVPDTQVIIIENKVNAQDQPHQLIRYKNAFPKAAILYLTKFGTPPNPLSTHIGGKGEACVNFKPGSGNKCISYEQHIHDWLLQCYQVSTRVPQLRETIHQYLNTVKRITNKTMDQSTALEIAKAVTQSGSSLEGFFNLRKQEVVKAVERQLLYGFIDGLADAAADLKLVYDGQHSNREMGHVEGESYVSFTCPNKGFQVYVGFKTWRQGCFVGLGPVSGHHLDAGKIDLLRDRLTASCGPSKDAANCYYRLYMDQARPEHRHFGKWEEGNYEVWGEVQSGEAVKTIKAYLQAIIDEYNAL